MITWSFLFIILALFCLFLAAISVFRPESGTRYGWHIGWLGLFFWLLGVEVVGKIQ